MGICLSPLMDTQECDENSISNVRISPADSNNTYIQLQKVNTVYSIKVGPSNPRSKHNVEWELDLEMKSSLNIDNYYLSANDDHTVVPKKPVTDGSYFVLGLNKDHLYYYMYLPTQNTSCQEKEENESLNTNGVGQAECGAGELELDSKEGTTEKYYLSTNGEDLKYIPIKSTDTLPMSCRFSIYPPPDLSGQTKVLTKSTKIMLK